MEGDKSCLNLVGSEIDELAFALGSVGVVVDLLRATVRSLWDAENDHFVGQQPSELRLDDFTYQSLRDLSTRSSD